MIDCEVFIGWDARARLAWNVCARSIWAHAEHPLPIRPIGMVQLAAAGLYKRPFERRAGVLWDTISGAPMSTEFALARFFVPFVTNAKWALFVDGDFMFRADVSEIIEHADQRYAVQVVKRAPMAESAVTKMDGQPQLNYSRKNWSSLVLWNMTHTANGRRLWLDEANHQPGIWLHQFGWLKDHEIGALPAEWNHLESVDDTAVAAKAVHFTLGTPDMAGHEDSKHAEEWRRYQSIADRALPYS